MSQPLFSSNWYRVKALRPRLRGHIQIHRHVYRNQVWYVVEDRASGKYHRFNPGGYRAIGLMDGRRDMQAVWDRLTQEVGEDTPTQDEIVRLLGQLHGADLIRCDVTPDVAELFERRGKQERRKWLGRLANPIALRFPLLDPDRRLGQLVGAFRWLWGWRGAAIWLAVVLPALLLAASHWPDLTENLGERLLAAQNLAILALVFPLVKAMHEIGHGIACKMRGGEVHEMGIMLLVFFPVPYVDASSTSAFASKWQRMLVGAAGMLTELFIAALAFYLWLMLEPGPARAIAYNVLILASVTTLFFNANPLLRFDGYYILADWLEIPNLGMRATRQWRHLADRYLLGVRADDPPPATPGERRWLLAYAPLAFLYRLSVIASIALFVAGQYFFFGVLIALWGLIASLGMPLFKMIRTLWSDPQYADRGPQIRRVLIAAGAGLFILIFVLPLPHHTAALGVLWLPEQAILRAEGTGFVTELSAEPGSYLTRGEAVLRSRNPDLDARLAVQAARMAEVQVRYDAARGLSPARANQLAEDLRRERATVERLREEISHLTLSSSGEGILLLPDAADLPGRFLKKGETVGYLRTDDPPLVRVVLPQPDVDQVRFATRAVEVRLPQDPAKIWSAQVRREVPAASRELPSPALGQQGGGDIPLDPSDPKGTRSLESLFQFELELPEAVPLRYPGSRVYVRFDHPPEPVGLRLGRAVRRLFLSHFEL